MRLHKYIVYTAYGWLALSGVLHFTVDVISQHIRDLRAPGPETMLYYGLNTSFALGQVVFGLLGLFLARRAPALIGTAPVMLLSFAAGLGWLAITCLFMEYAEPKASAGLFLLLLTAARLTRR